MHSSTQTVPCKPIRAVITTINQDTHTHYYFSFSPHLPHRKGKNLHQTVIIWHNANAKGNDSSDIRTDIWNFLCRYNCLKIYLFLKASLIPSGRKNSLKMTWIIPFRYQSSQVFITKVSIKFSLQTCLVSYTNVVTHDRITIKSLFVELLLLLLAFMPWSDSKCIC